MGHGVKSRLGHPRVAVGGPTLALGFVLSGDDSDLLLLDKQACVIFYKRFSYLRNHKTIFLYPHIHSGYLIFVVDHTKRSYEKMAKTGS